MRFYGRHIDFSSNGIIILFTEEKCGGEPMEKIKKSLLIITILFTLVSCAGVGYQGDDGGYREPGRDVQCDTEGHCWRGGIKLNFFSPPARTVPVYAWILEKE